MTENTEKIHELDFLLRNWRGTGSITIQGKQFTFEQTERVQLKMGGAVVLVEGHGLENGKPSHESLAVLTRGNGHCQFEFRSYLASGESDTHPATIADGIWIWGYYDHRLAAEIRFTIKLNEKGQWLETGERSADGKTWEKYFEMTLDRV